MEQTDEVVLSTRAPCTVTDPVSCAADVVEKTARARQALDPWHESQHDGPNWGDEQCADALSRQRTRRDNAVHLEGGERHAMSVVIRSREPLMGSRNRFSTLFGGLKPANDCEPPLGLCRRFLSGIKAFERCRLFDALALTTMLLVVPQSHFTARSANFTSVCLWRVGCTLDLKKAHDPKVVVQIRPPQPRTRQRAREALCRRSALSGFFNGTSPASVRVGVRNVLLSTALALRDDSVIAAWLSFLVGF